jgi:hypothetical protein
MAYKLQPKTKRAFRNISQGTILRQLNVHLADFLPWYQTGLPDRMMLLPLDRIFLSLKVTEEHEPALLEWQIFHAIA